MPEIARFLGIIIRMYPEAGGPHHLAHFHAYYQDAAAAYSIDDIDVIADVFHGVSTDWVTAWAELHQTELEENWTLLQAGRTPSRIDPLR